MLDFNDWYQERSWVEKKAKEASSLSAEDIAFLDRGIAQRIKEQLEQRAAYYWWKLFGLQGHSLETLEDEARFVCELDKVFVYPAPSDLLSPATGARQPYTVRYISKRGKQEIAEFIAPPPSRLLELMLYGYFRHRDSWIYLSRSSKGGASSSGSQPGQWMVLPETARPSERLGLIIKVCATPLHDSVPPGAAFSSLSDKAKIQLAGRIGSKGTHLEWLQSIIDNSTKQRLRGWGLSIYLAGEYPTDGFPLAELIANDGHISGKKVETINGNLFDLRPENLRTKSSRGRKMVCSACRKPTTAEDSRRVKDASGSSIRICRSCQAWGARLARSNQPTDKA